MWKREVSSPRALRPYAPLPRLEIHWRVRSLNIQVYSPIKVSWPRWHIPRPHVVNFRVSAGRHALFLSTDLNTIVKLLPFHDRVSSKRSKCSGPVDFSNFHQRFRDEGWEAWKDDRDGTRRNAMPADPRLFPL